ncbi:MAG: GtrA family protein [Clostridiales bacterium]|nr:GtrA family protein [Clostridiales bacterium]
MSNNAEDASKLKKLISNKKFQEIFWYFVFGVLTTVVNLIVFALLDKLFNVKWPVQIFGYDFDMYIVFVNCVAWVAAIVFAYVTNKLFVFHTKGNVVREFISFVGARLFTFFAFEVGLFSLGIMLMENTFKMPQDDLWIELFGFRVTNKYIIKIFIAFFVVVANYIFSKLFIFKKDKKDEKKDASEPTEEVKEA